MGSDIFPRVLVIAHEPFNNVLGCGITMSNLFKEWPKSRIASLYWDEIVPEHAVCDRFYRLGSSEWYWRFPISILLDRPNRNDGTHTRSPKGDSANSKSEYLHKLSRSLGGLTLWRKVSLSRDLRKWVSSFSPDVIYSVPTDLPTLRLVAKLADFTGARIVTHIYDDWLSRDQSASGLLDPLYSRIVSQQLTKLISRSSLRLGIGADMCTAYEMRFGAPFVPFQNCPDLEPWMTNGKLAWHVTGDFTFRFFGALYEHGNITSLVALAQGIEALSNHTCSVELEIFTDENCKRRFGFVFGGLRSTKLKTLPSDTAEVAALYGGADGLILAYDFGDANGGWLKYSMPTKLPVCMLSGSPMLVYAPSTMSATRFLKKAQSAYVIETQTPLVDLKNHLTNFVEDEGLRQTFALHAREAALTSMVAEVVRPTFTKAIIRASKKDGSLFEGN